MPSEATIAPPEVDANKRDAVNSGSGVEEPPAKKARVEESSESNGQSRPLRERGIAPIKAEYACLT